MNIEFEYLYRDCGNFKNYGRAVFANKGNLSAKDIHEKILSVLVPEPFLGQQTSDCRTSTSRISHTTRNSITNCMNITESRGRRNLPTIQLTKTSRTSCWR